MLGVPPEAAAALRAACQPLVDYLEQDSEDEEDESEEE